MVAVRDRPFDQAQALAREALAAWRGSDPDQAIDACDHALALLLPVGPSDALADVLRCKGSILRDRGSHAAASDLYGQSLAVADSIGYQVGRAYALNCLGTIAQFRGDLIAAERWYGEAARLAHRLGERRLWRTSASLLPASSRRRSGTRSSGSSTTSGYCTRAMARMPGQRTRSTAL
jgi:tetratricopeptide (TPR) repeat protein